MIVTVTPIVEGVEVVGRSTTITVTTGTVGPTGATGAVGATGSTGAQGDPGEGVPTGGTTGQALVKASGTDFDTAWDDVAGGGGAVDSVNGQTGVVVLDADDLADGTTNHVFTAADDTKLAGVATGATANDTDANLKARANHTGTQAISTVTGLQTALDGKDTALAAHEAAADPHPGYLTPAEGNAAYDTTGAAAAAQAAAVQRANHTGTQIASTVSDFSEAVDDRVAALLVAGTNVTLTYNDGAGTLTVAASGGGGSTDPHPYIFRG